MVPVTLARAATNAGQVAGSLVRISRQLARGVARLSFGRPVTHVYNPLQYARAAHEQYLTRFGDRRRRVLLLGMNPGPFGMAQTGVPFGDVRLVRDWMGICARVGKPAREHPRREVRGFDCPRSEASGSRLWGWARARFGPPEAFFRTFFVLNYCPLVFMEESGKNRTPNHLAPAERNALFRTCDEALCGTARVLDPVLVIGVGRFAEERARAALAPLDVRIGGILHPSPASPSANRGWEKVVEGQLREYGIELPS
jgi:single-strand selective monofunctional uracil DNA glycosylase